MRELEKLKAERDALNERIKLIEDGIRKGAERASYASQLIKVNELRQRDGRRPLTPSEFASGVCAGDQS